MQKFNTSGLDRLVDNWTPKIQYVNCEVWLSTLWALVRVIFTGQNWVDIIWLSSSCELLNG